MDGRFEAYDVALAMVRSLRPVVTRLRARDGDLTRQLVRAASSVTNNLAEGAQRRGADRLHHYRVASGSAAEVRSTLATADAWGYLPTGATGEVDVLCDRVLAMLYRLLHPRR
jgi:four helix bundle protein